MEHSHGALGIDFDSLSKVVDCQIVLAKVLVHETSLYPNGFVLWQFIYHSSELLQSFMEVVNLLEHHCCVELAFQEVLVLVQGFKVASDCKLHQWEYLRLYTGHFLIRSVLCEVLLVGLGERGACW